MVGHVVLQGTSRVCFLSFPSISFAKSFLTHFSRESSKVNKNSVADKSEKPRESLREKLLSKLGCGCKKRDQPQLSFIISRVDNLNDSGEELFMMAIRSGDFAWVNDSWVMEVCCRLFLSPTWRVFSAQRHKNKSTESLCAQMAAYSRKDALEH